MDVFIDEVIKIGIFSLAEILFANKYKFKIFDWRFQMSKFLFYGSYAPEGLKGVLAEGGSGRVEAAKISIDFRPPGD